MRSANLTETLIKSIKNLNWRLYASLVLMGLVPTVYTTVRTFFLGQLPGEWAYSIAGQLSWVNLLYEILDEAIILPLFFCLGPPREDPAEFSNRVRTGLFASGAIYLAFAAVITAFAKPLLMLMAADPGIIESSASYIRIEAAANVFGMLFESVVTNSVYYGGAFAAYMLGLWTPTLTGVALMFGIGNIFDAAVSALVYRHFRKRI